MTTLEDQGLLEFRIAPMSIISSLYVPGGTGLYFSLKGLSSIRLFLCFTCPVCPRSGDVFWKNAVVFVEQDSDFLFLCFS